MVRAVHFGPQFSAQLSSLCGRGAATGLVLGSHTDNDRSFGVCLVETPKVKGGSKLLPSCSLVVGDMTQHHVCRRFRRARPGIRR